VSITINKPAFDSDDYFIDQRAPEVTLRIELVIHEMQFVSQVEYPKILEVGVGSEDMTVALARRFDSLTSVDSNECNFTKVGKRLADLGLPHVNMVLSRIEVEDLEPDGYDHILLQNMMEHLEFPVENLN
jgi:2-polyprenyl-3-methyl-5-hydroxy-6-metoxy-1,4-benzoquinol methylase